MQTLKKSPLNKVLFLKLFILLILLVVCIQDITTRLVYWIAFPLLALSFFYLNHLQGAVMREQGQAAIMNIGLVLIQLLLISAYFSFKEKKLVMLTKQYLGIGDIFFLLSVACYLSVFNFLFFYVISLVVTLAAWLTVQSFLARKRQEVPLAGLQSLVLILLLISSWWLGRPALTDDTWIQNLLRK